MVPDLKPPRLVAGERKTLQALLQYQRDSFVRKVAGVNDVDARRNVVGSDTTLLWLLQHMGRGESLWIIHRFAGQKMDPPESSVDRDEAVESAIVTYKEVWREVDTVIENTPSLDQVCQDV